ncbi:L-aspartate oxidase [uncultured Synechococcales cyanobacterium]|uniref:L-aspartate oxidase n=1 Tax=uncultured Synechococcales cyanobacterium TaxID=1936017 RepID=A0A6J4VG79_9CYAN|nr:L-aspartate oxidase [uncultured Synechococcales cyanobacterium]
MQGIAVEYKTFDVLIIGGGAAGLYAALCLPPHLKVGLVTKGPLALSASDWAQGGVAAAIDPKDSPDAHAKDTIKAGAGLCEPEVVQFLVEQAPQQIKLLVELGVDFDRAGSQLALTLEAAHSQPRVLHAADTTGRKLVTTLTAQVLSRPNIQVLPETFTLSLWMHPHDHYCQGVSVLYQGQITWVRARAVVLATGGGGQVFAQTTNPELSTGDGVAMAWRTGALLRDLEFVQFHPTALTLPGAPRFLISESVRGEGAHLVDSQGKRFVFDYHPAGELAPRDVVSRAIFSHLQTTSSLTAGTSAPDHQVWLDLRPIARSRIHYRFPKIIQVCQNWGINVFEQPVPVAPAAHYWMGGVATDLQGLTSIPGLYAVGEVASTGVHGANRLASNSLLECLVFAAQLSKSLSQAEVVTSSSLQAQQAWLPKAAADWSSQKLTIEQLRRDLPVLMWQSAGICREEKVLKAAIAQVENWKDKFAQLPLSQCLLNLHPGQPLAISVPEADLEIRAWAETQNLLDVAQLILKSAAFRPESRGGHYRLDYPQLDSSWQVHTLVQGDHWQKSAPI